MIGCFEKPGLFWGFLQYIVERNGSVEHEKKYGGARVSCGLGSKGGKE